LDEDPQCLLSLRAEVEEFHPRLIAQTLSWVVADYPTL